MPFRKESNPDGRMTVFEHLGELRRRLMISIVAVVVAGTLVFIFAPEIISWLITFYNNAVPRGHGQKFIFTGPLDAFATRLKIATYGGIVLALPVWLFQLWRFITPGLNPKEKQYAIPFIIASIILFAIGAVVALLTLQPALQFLLNIGGADLRPLLTADKYLSLVSLMIVAFGVVVRVPGGAGVPADRARAEHPAAARAAAVRRRRHRGLRGDHHAEPGPVLSVRDGDSAVPLLRGVIVIGRIMKR